MNNSSDPSFAREFKLSITRALGDQLFEALAGTSTAKLSKDNIEDLERRPGVYELHHVEAGELKRVYVGKATKSLPERINKHFEKLSGREGILIEEMAFKCAYVDEDFDAAAPEKMLIKQHVKNGEVVWNNNGFGNNDPGKRRDKSLVKQNHFDAIYPANLGLQFSASELGIIDGSSAFQTLAGLKSALPFVVRFPTTKASAAEKAELTNSTLTSVEVFPELRSADEWFREVIRALPETWQITVLPGYVIAYRSREEYPSARWYWRKEGDTPVRIEGERALDKPGVVEPEDDLFS